MQTWDRGTHKKARGRELKTDWDTERRGEKCRERQRNEERDRDTETEIRRARNLGIQKRQRRAEDCREGDRDTET